MNAWKIGGAACVGAILGAIHFGGLWLTVRKIPASAAPGRLLAASFAIRTAFTATGFWFVSRGSWDLLAAALVGFICCRSAVQYLALPPPVESGRTGKEHGE